MAELTLSLLLLGLAFLTAVWMRTHRPGFLLRAAVGTTLLLFFSLSAIFFAYRAFY